MKNAKALTITFLTPVSFASLNGSDKEAENISSIKKLTRGTEEFPYVSSQAVRRALREQLASLGWELSEGVPATIAKGAATTQQQPEKYIDDDLFGFMGAEREAPTKKGKAITRTSPVRVSPLISMQKYEGDLDFGTNYMAVRAGGDPNIFETEIHSGTYRGTILIELDRVGRGDDFSVRNDEKEKRVIALLTAIKNLWSSGRQTRFLADISPKFIAAALLRTKNPIFLESVVPFNGGVRCDLIEEALSDYREEVVAWVLGGRKGIFDPVPKATVSVGDAFDTMQQWLRHFYAEEN